MKDFDEESLASKKGGQYQVDDVEAEDVDDQELPEHANPLVLLVERDGSRRRVYKRQDTGEILYTTRNYNGLKGYLKYYYIGHVLSEEEAPKSDDFTASSSSSTPTHLPFAVFENTTIELIDQQTGGRMTSQDNRFVGKWFGKDHLLTAQGRKYKLNYGWRGDVKLRRPDETRKNPPLAHFKHKAIGLGTDQGSVTLHPSLIYEGSLEGAPDDAFMINGKPTMLLDLAIVADYAVCRLTELAVVVVT